MQARIRSFAVMEANTATSGFPSRTRTLVAVAAGWSGEALRYAPVSPSCRQRPAASALAAWSASGPAVCHVASAW